jgi:hypothetical protein
MIISCDKTRADGVGFGLILCVLHGKITKKRRRVKIIKPLLALCGRKDGGDKIS